MTVAQDDSKERQDDRAVLAEWMCGAKLRGERTGPLRRNPKINGASKCHMHDTATALVREKAAAVIAPASYPAALKLRARVDDPYVKDGFKLTAIRDMLDRGGLGSHSAPATFVDVSVSNIETTIDSAVRHVRPAPPPDVWDEGDTRPRW